MSRCVMEVFASSTNNCRCLCCLRWLPNGPERLSCWIDLAVPDNTVGSALMQNYYAACVLLASSAGMTLGCGDPERPRTECNAAGVVTVSGAPTAGVYVYLSEMGNIQAATLGARTDANGAFSISVAKPGEHAVTANWPQVVLDHGEEIEGEDRFKGKHANPNRPILQVNIQKGENILPPINLKR